MRRNIGENRDIILTPDFAHILRAIRLISYGFMFVSFIIPYIVSQKMKLSDMELGFVWSLQLIGFTVPSLFVGTIADVVPKRYLIMFGSFGRGFVYILLYLAVIYTSFPLILISVFFLGFVVGFFWVPISALVSDKSHPDNRAYALGRLDRSATFGMLFGAILGFMLFSIFSIYTPGNKFLIYSAFLLYAICNFVGGYYVIRRIDENLTYIHVMEGFTEDSIEKKKEKISFSGAIKGFVYELKNSDREFIKAALMLMITFLIVGMNVYITAPYIIVFIMERITNDPVAAIASYYPASAVSTFLSPYIGKFIDRHDIVKSVLMFGLIGAAVTYLLINSPNYLVFTVILIFDTIFSTASQTTVNNVFSKLSVNYRGTVFGIKNLFGNIGMIIGPLLGGFFADSYGITAPFILSIFIELCIIIPFSYSIKRLKPFLEGEQSKNKK